MLKSQHPPAYITHTVLIIILVLLVLMQGGPVGGGEDTAGEAGDGRGAVAVYSSQHDRIANLIPQPV